MQIPLPGDFKFVWKGGPDPETPMLTNHYYSDTTFHDANSRWENYFSENGWNVVERDWTTVRNSTTYRKPGYEVVIQFGGMGKGVNYAITCIKLK